MSTTMENHDIVEYAMKLQRCSRTLYLCALRFNRGNKDLFRDISIADMENNKDQFHALVDYFMDQHAKRMAAFANKPNKNTDQISPEDLNAYLGDLGDCDLDMLVEEDNKENDDDADEYDNLD